MFPLLPFALGALAGAAAVNLTRRAVARVSLDKTQARLRQATVCGLAAVERSSAKLREKLASTEAPHPETAAGPAPPPTSEVNQPPADESNFPQESNP